jgi:hypothetical protein
VTKGCYGCGLRCVGRLVILVGFVFPAVGNGTAFAFRFGPRLAGCCCLELGGLERQLGKVRGDLVFGLGSHDGKILCRFVYKESRPVENRVLRKVRRRR